MSQARVRNRTEEARSAATLQGRCNCPKPAFTLVELIAVVVAVGLLVGIVQPSLEEIRQRSKLAGCLKRLGDIGTASRSILSAIQTAGAFPCIRGSSATAQGECRKIPAARGYSDGVGDCQPDGATLFEVRYYADGCGLPGELMAGPFSQAGGTLEVAPPARTCETLADFVTENVYFATHGDVLMLEGKEIWLEISNSASGSCAWYWATDRWRGSAMQDGRGSGVPDGYGPTDVVMPGLAFCVDAYPLAYSQPVCRPSPANDECVDALPIDEGDTFFNTLGSTTDGPAESGCGFLLGDDQINYDIWYDYLAPCSGVLTVEMCEGDFDTKVAVYEQATCPPQRSPVACNDDACGPDLSLQSLLSVPVTVGERYAVRIGGSVSAGTGTINLNYTARPPSDTNLSDYANLAACYTGACSNPPCDPPLYTSLCCESRDYDRDGDVDLDDFGAISKVLTGP